MSLKQYIGHNVKILADNGETFIGLVEDYIFPEDNENNKESIIIKTLDGSLCEFIEEDIEIIAII